MTLQDDDDSLKAPTLIGDETGRPPPWWMGPVFLAFGVVMLLLVKPSAPGTPAAETPLWVAYCACSIFALAGVYLILVTMGYPRAAMWALWLTAVTFATLFNWIGFGPGERLGSSSMGFGGGGGGVSTTSGGQNVKPYFAAFTGMMDVIIVWGLWSKARKQKRV